MPGILKSLVTLLFLAAMDFGGPIPQQRSATRDGRTSVRLQVGAQQVVVVWERHMIHFITKVSHINLLTADI